MDHDFDDPDCTDEDCDLHEALATPQDTSAERVTLVAGTCITCSQTVRRMHGELVTLDGDAVCHALGGHAEHCLGIACVHTHGS